MMMMPAYNEKHMLAGFIRHSYKRSAFVEFCHYQDLISCKYNA